MPKFTQHILSVGVPLSGLLLFCAHPPALAQQPASHPAAQALPKDQGQSDAKAKKPAQTKKEERREILAGIASKLNTTPEALQGQWKAARTANPNLKFSQFVAANVIAHNLGPTHPKVTTVAILSGLQGGSTVTRTLEGLGLGVDDAKKARADARAVEAEAERYSASPAK